MHLLNIIYLVKFSFFFLSFPIGRLRARGMDANAQINELEKPQERLWCLIVGCLAPARA